MIRFLLMLFVCCLGMVVTAQEIAAPKGCGYDHYVHFLDHAYPGFKAAADQTFEDNKSAISFRDNEVYTIPVVVHIVWQEEEQNLSDLQIKNVIEVLNEDYRRLNADADMIRSEFVDVVGDPLVEFELAGIERQQTEATFELDLFGGSLPDNVKQSEEGGSDAWDPEKFMNIWVCNIEGGSLLGYAYPPADLEHWPEDATAPSPELDGVVIHYEVFRREGTYTTSGFLGLDDVTVPVRGRTVTHEVGHYLGLRHIWGDGLLSVIGIPDCDADDGVEDTPQQGLNSQFQCDPALNTCGDGADDLPDMFENFMDYASEDCMNSFTEGQIAIIRSVLENERSGLISEVTSTEDSFVQKAFSIYPNPAQDQLFISTSQFRLDEFQIRLVDQQGRILEAVEIDSFDKEQSIDVSAFPAGVYNVLLTSGEDQYVERIIIQ